MKEIKKMVKKNAADAVAKLAVTMATYSANSACTFWMYQEKETAEMKKLRKF